MPKRTCSFPGCKNPQTPTGLCSGHRRQSLKGQPLRPLRKVLQNTRHLTLEQRFWVKVDKDAPGGCWQWTAYKNPAGYGQINVGGRMALAHRFSWELANGPIPAGLHIDHRCGNRACMNPAHLRVVTRSQNNQHLTVIRKDNKSGVRGVRWNKDRNAWHVEVGANGKSYFGGLHPTLESADAAARALRAELHTHDDHEEWLQTQE